MTVVFWNINKNAKAISSLAAISDEENADIVAIAEYPKQVADVDLLAEMNKYGKDYVVLHPAKIEKVKILYRPASVSILNQSDNKHIHVKKFFVSGIEFFIVFVHLKSKMGTSSMSQAQSILPICDEIRDFESTYHTKQTVVCGDFNLSPYDGAMVLPTHFNSTMNSTIASTQIRTFDKENYDYFYNPMWNLLGDEQQGKITGTYYYTQEPSVPQWSILDQVIIRPSVLQYFDYKKLKILSTGKGYNLLKNNKVNDSISDHLPIKFEINV